MTGKENQLSQIKNTTRGLEERIQSLKVHSIDKYNKKCYYYLISRSFKGRSARKSNQTERNIYK